MREYRAWMMPLNAREERIQREWLWQDFIRKGCVSHTTVEYELLCRYQDGGITLADLGVGNDTREGVLMILGAAMVT